MAIPSASVAIDRPVPVAVDETTISDHERMRKHFDKMDRVLIKIPKDRGSQWVQVNGYTFEIAAGVEVRVPKQIAEMLREASVI